MRPDTIHIVQVDYSNATHAEHLVFLLNHYAQDPMGGGAPLLPEVKNNLSQALAQQPSALSLLAYINEQPVGLVNAFWGFSTFACKPLLNIHDLVVLSDARGKGVSQALLAKAEELVREKGGAKLTLEVLQGNKVAQSAYLKFGFKGYVLDENMGHALFWEKKL